MHILTTNEIPTDDELVELVRKHEHEQRKDAMRELIGRRVMISDQNQHVVRVLAGGEYFTDKREEFPSILLMARVHLALQFSSGETLEEDWEERWKQKHQVGWRREILDWLPPITETVTTATETATEKEPGVWKRAKALLKGVRP